MSVQGRIPSPTPPPLLLVLIVERRGEWVITVEGGGLLTKASQLYGDFKIQKETLEPRVVPYILTPAPKFSWLKIDYNGFLLKNKTY